MNRRKVLWFTLGGITLLLLGPLLILSLPPPYSTSTHVIRSGDDVPKVLEASSSAGPCLDTETRFQPPCNPGLARSEWSISHGGSYAQGSSSYPGPRPGSSYLAQHIDLPNVSITFSFSEPYTDGGIAVWGSPLTREGVVVKLDHQAFEVIDIYNPQLEEIDPPKASLSITGAYNMVDRDGHFIVARQRSIEVYADSIPGDRFSKISLLKRFQLPDAFFCGENDTLVGFNLTYDDHLVFVSQNGVVGVLPRQPEQMAVRNLRTHSIIGLDCTAERLQQVSNSIAVDESGGIYVVTSAEMYKIAWDGDQLSLRWHAPYKASGSTSALRLGPGSGSTPSLMGLPQDRDRFVVITDGQELMHLVLMWRDEIPPGWMPLAEGLDPRVACEIPVRFGDPESQRSLSEQSVLVRGYSAVLVNNRIQKEPVLWRWLPSFLRNAFAAMEGADSDNAPYGIERIDWDPATRTCETVWANSRLSIPNAIPTMSQVTGLIYAVGQRQGVWGLEAIDFGTGKSAFFIEARQVRCTLTSMQQLTPLWLRWIIAPSRLIRGASCENAFYAATEIGPGGTIYTGTSLGASKYTPFSE